jgi:hypothetical protein
MLENPPHIRVTNYAVLEHILLLPRNRALLAGADVRWLVLDEIHTYTGAQAIEVAFLLRKLKARLGVPEDRSGVWGRTRALTQRGEKNSRALRKTCLGSPFRAVTARQSSPKDDCIQP